MKPPTSQPRPKTQTPADLVTEILTQLRRTFYPTSFTDPDAKKRWYQDQRFLTIKFICYPAAWLTHRGLLLPPERIRSILLALIRQVAAHGATGAIQYWPGYLAKVVQDHFRFHADEINAEAKSVAALVSINLAQAALSRTQPRPDAAAAAQQTMVDLRSVLAPRRKPKPSKPAPAPTPRDPQLGLL